MKQTKKHLTNQNLIDMLNKEIEKNGSGVWSDRRKTIEEMLRMRGVKLITGYERHDLHKGGQ